MQEEIENRTVTLIISAVKLTARELKAGMDKYLSEKKSKAMEKARAAPEKPSGKQTVRQLIGQNQGVSNIEITNSNIKGFERIARKYGVDFAVKKDRSVSPPKYFVFFKARDADALTAAFKEYTAYELKRAAKRRTVPPCWRICKHSRRRFRPLRRGNPEIRTGASRYEETSEYQEVPAAQYPVCLYRPLCHQAGAGVETCPRHGLFGEGAAPHGGLCRRVPIGAAQLPPH